MALTDLIVVNVSAVMPEETRMAIWRIEYLFYRLEVSSKRPPGLPSLRITM